MVFSSIEFVRKAAKKNPSGSGRAQKQFGSGPIRYGVSRVVVFDEAGCILAV
jgi:hypothetical protein